MIIMRWSSMKKKKKIKNRRHISSTTMFPKKEAFNLMLMQQSLEQAFPDPEKRKAYVEEFLRNVENEKYIPDGQLTISEEIRSDRQISDIAHRDEDE